VYGKDKTLVIPVQERMKHLHTHTDTQTHRHTDTQTQTQTQTQTHTHARTETTRGMLDTIKKPGIASLSRPPGQIDTR